MKNDYIPHKEDALILWHDEFLSGTTNHGPGLGLTAPNLAAIAADNQALHADIAAAAAAEAAAKSATATKKATIKRVVSATRAYARRMKAAPGYTEGLGDAMGIEAPENTTNLSTSKPTLTGKAKSSGHVEIAFNKSISDGVNIYCHRDGDSGPAFPARGTNSPYLDNLPLLVPGKPEIRKYHAVYVVNDVEVGAPSDEAVVIAAP